MASGSANRNHLVSLAETLSSAADCVPAIEALQPPSDGLSLLHVKNQLLLSYVQNLVFLILFKLRNHASPDLDGNSCPSHDDIVKNLVSLRLYLEKGVRPLESRLKYQLDKLLLAASEAESMAPHLVNGATKFKKSKRSSAGSDSASNDDESTAPVSDLSHRPNLAAFARPRKTSPSSNTKDGRDPGVYRPPRITPTALPTTDRTAQNAARKRKNNVLDNFVAEELSSAPIAEPSIGAGTGLRGRDAERERERRDYEETRLVRLPSEGKKGKRNGRRERIGGGFDDVLGGAGEGLGEAVKGSGGKRRKIGGGGGMEGMRVGEKWEKRKKMGVRGLGGKRR